jgi:hypothetical protein
VVGLGQQVPHTLDGGLDHDLSFDGVQCHDCLLWINEM